MPLDDRAKSSMSQSLAEAAWIETVWEAHGPLFLSK